MGYAGYNDGIERFRPGRIQPVDQGLQQTGDILIGGRPEDDLAGHAIPDDNILFTIRAAVGCVFERPLRQHLVNLKDVLFGDLLAVGQGIDLFQYGQIVQNFLFVLAGRRDFTALGQLAYLLQGQPVSFDCR